MAAEPLFVRGTATATASWQACRRNNKNNSHSRLLYFSIRASHSTDKKNKVYKQLGPSLLSFSYSFALFQTACICVVLHGIVEMPSTRLKFL